MEMVDSGFRFRFVYRLETGLDNIYLLYQCILCCLIQSRPILQSFSESHFSNNSLRIGCFNAHSIGPSAKRSEINHFILDNQIDVFFLVETWLKDSGDEPKIADVTPIYWLCRQIFSQVEQRWWSCHYSQISYTTTHCFQIIFQF